MRRKALRIALVLIPATFGTVYVADRLRDPDRAPPSGGCMVSDLERGPLASAAAIRRYSVAGIRLGMPLAQADAALRAHADYVDVPLPDVPKDLGDLAGKAGFKNVLRAMRLKQEVVPASPGTERRTIVTIGATRDEAGHDVVSRISYVVIHTDQEEVDRVTAYLARSFGTPTAQYDSTCGPFRVVSYSPSRKVETPEGLLTIQRCSAFGAETFRPPSCNRARAVDTAWAAVVGTGQTYALLVEDGALTYRTRYSPWYKKSVSNSEMDR